MDALQQHHRLMGAPQPQQQPPMADPQLRPSPSQGTWYSSQFQYHTSHLPPPPPPQQMQWVNYSDHHHIPAPAYSAQPNPSAPPSYAAHPHSNNQYPPPPSVRHLPPPLQHPHPNPNCLQIPQPYPPSNQTWGNSNWTHHQGWEYSDRNIPNNNEEDWAARAREWAAAKATMENQYPQSQFPPPGRLEEHSDAYHDQYQQAVDPHYTESQQSSRPAWSYQQQFPVSGTNLHRPPVNHLQDSTSFSSGQPSSYVSDGHISYGARDGPMVADSDPVFGHQGSAPTSSTIYPQEVPSSYSSVQAGKEEAVEQIDQSHQQAPLPKSTVQDGQHHMQPMLRAIGRSSSAELPRFTYDNQITDATADPSDQPLDFAPRFTRENDPHLQTGYAHPDSAGHVGGVDHIAAVHAWTPPVATGVAYPPAPPVPQGSQFDPSFVPPVSGHTAPVFGRIPGPSFQPRISTVGAPFGLGAGAAVHPTTAFPGDAYGVLNVSERPKKASVPNWLREEIIKKKAVISTSVQEHLEEDHFLPVGDEGLDKSFKKGYQVDDKSVDSSRSTEDEDDEEDELEVARTTAINQEIKRVLTEVLLKVTDELFDEIATEVLSEDDLSVKVDHDYSPPNHKVSLSSPAVPTPKVSAKVLIPVKAKEADAVDVSGKSSASSPGDVLGLGSYASDDDEIQSFNMPASKQTDAEHWQSTDGKLAEVVPSSVENVNLKNEGPTGGRINMDSDQKRNIQFGAIGNGLGKVLDHENDRTSALRVVQDDKNNAYGEKMVNSDAFESKDRVAGSDSINPELLPGTTKFKKSVADDSHGREARNLSGKSDGHLARNSVSENFISGGETNKTKTVDRHPDSTNPCRRDGRHARNEKGDDCSGVQERVKDQVARSDEKAKESDSRKSSHANSLDDKKEAERTKRVSSKEDSNRKRERARDDRGDGSRRKTERDSSRHKRRRSSSFSRHSDSSDEVSDGLDQRKMHTKRHNLSTSPTQSRKRQVLRSPHSKHSQRRHSPYSSLDTTRGKRSRSNSPVRRRR
ncbi:hypothetical protein NE237_021746 [Protea cynaroides]|uniref:Uncharacterized protein n=1 Tax=Protea cynaroides TaxID=273540 RepID=A0A9Q0H8C7_9MAGN|nr:hypothetical protein NE237_021746 [Protea cynaroides]